MRFRTAVFTVVAAAVLVGLAGPALAADDPEEPPATDTPGQPEDDSLVEADFFKWYREGDDPDWARGGFFAALGAIGAMVIAFTAIGSVLPNTAGKLTVDRDAARLETLSARLQLLTESESPDAGAIAAVNTTVNDLRDDLDSERWKQYALATGFYMLLGAFFASAIAGDLVQAIVIGAGWTGLVGSFGLKTDYNQRKEEKDAAIDTVVGTLRAQATLDPGAEPEAVNDARATAAFARSL